MCVEMYQTSSSFQLSHVIGAKLFCVEHAIGRKKPPESKEKSSLYETHVFSEMHEYNQMLRVLNTHSVSRETRQVRTWALYILCVPIVQKTRVLGREI